MRKFTQSTKKKERKADLGYLQNGYTQKSERTPFYMTRACLSARLPNSSYQDLQRLVLGETQAELGGEPAAVQLARWLLFCFVRLLWLVHQDLTVDNMDDSILLHPCIPLGMLLLVLTAPASP